tara:strand:+ start:848 stop:1327 length:480 start_codon:yes stop_codon:yes gene_type:complete
MVRYISLILFSVLAWGQDTTSFSLNNENALDKLVQSFRSDLGKFYTVTYYGEFLGQKNNKVYFKPINDVPLKLLRLKEIKELKQDNKVLIKNGKWNYLELEIIKPYKGTFIDSEETSTEELLKYKKVKTAHILIGCCIISAAAIGGIVLWFYDNFTILP